MTEQHSPRLPDPAFAAIDATPGSRPDPNLRSFERGFRTVDGVRLHYVSGGNPDGEVVVLLAGFPESWYAWRKVMPVLGQVYRIIAPDLPGQATPTGPRVATIRNPWRQRYTGCFSSSALSCTS